MPANRTVTGNEAMAARPVTPPPPESCRRWFAVLVDRAGSPYQSISWRWIISALFHVVHQTQVSPDPSQLLQRREVTWVDFDAAVEWWAEEDVVSIPMYGYLPLADCWWDPMSFY